MTFEIEGSGSITEKSQSGSETVAGSIYGFQWRDRNVGKCDGGIRLYRVEFHTNAFFLLASVASVGFYVPQTVEWWCEGPEDAEDGELLRPEHELPRSE